MKYNIILKKISLGILVFFANTHNPIAQNMWSKTYGNGGFDVGYSIKRTVDKGFIIVGATNSYSAENVDILAIKLDSLGNQQFLKLFIEAEYGYSVQQTKDKGFIIAGISWISYNKAKNVIIKTDKEGNYLWSDITETENSEWIHSVIESSDSCYILTGETISINGGVYGPWLKKLDKNGNSLWKKDYFDYGTSVNGIVESFDGGYIVAGDDGLNLWLMKTNSIGVILWSKSYHEFRTAQSLKLTNDGGYITCGFSSEYQASVVKTDSLGEIMWSKIYEGDKTYSPEDIIQTRDHGYLVCGNSVGEYFSDNDAWLLKLKYDGEV